MSRKSNPALIGGFILGAAMLAILAVIAFSSDRFFRQATPFVVFFDGSVQGLDVGAPVSFRGVRIGSVRDVVLMTNPKSADIDIKVIIEVEHQKAEDEVAGISIKDLLDRLIARGLRAQLASQSMLTGKLYVDLDFHPGAPMDLAGLDDSMAEIPAIPTDLEQLQKTLWTAIEKIEAMPIDKIFENLDETLAGLNRLTNGSKAQDTFATLETAIRDLQALIQNLDAQVAAIGGGMSSTLDESHKFMQSVNKRIDPIAENVEGTARAARATMENVERITAFEDPKTAALMDEATATVGAARTSLEQATQTMKRYESLAREDSQLYIEFNEALSELASASRAIRVFSDYLERHPEALIQGKAE